MPHKVAIIEHLDELTEEARMVGACNTVFLRRDEGTGARRYVGTNTDVVGIREAFYKNVQGAEEVSSPSSCSPAAFIDPDVRNP